MSNLDTMTKSFNVVLNVPNKLDVSNFEKRLQNLYDFFDRNCIKYACIRHDLDTDKDNILKTIHYHLVIARSTRTRISTMLYTIADCLGYSDMDLLNTIQVDKCDSIPLSIQYLVHKNNADKYQYDRNDIASNYTVKEIDDFFQFENTEITTRYLYDLVRQGKNDIEIMFIIGVGRYHLFKGAINDIRYAIQTMPNRVDTLIADLDNGR